MRLTFLVANLACVLSFGFPGYPTPPPAAPEWSGLLSFTSCGSNSFAGPSQGQCDAVYASTSLAGKVTLHDGIQKWVVPHTGTYRITVVGASGGGSSLGQSGAAWSSGRPTSMAGDFSLTKGEELQILVGQPGTGGTASGGGGGSFVAKGASYNVADPIIVAGGGGGYGSSGGGGKDASTGSSGTNGWPGYGFGSNGYGSSSSQNGGWGSSGAGWRGDGNGLNQWIGANSNSAGALAKAFINGGRGALGSDSINGASCNGMPGGFGGGGDGACNGGGGGGGYSGGGQGGGGGGSYNSGSSQVNTVVQSSSSIYGEVTIDLV